tara:strand:- start:67 stop:543 length:477 start_codon:yes stop_codon:yes gene_type:complete
MDATDLRIKEVIPNFKNIEHKMFDLKSSYKKTKKIVNQKFFREKVNTWKIQENDTTYYYGILDNVIGKAMPITFLTLFKDTGEIFDISIIKYREPYGGEVKSENWLKKFIGYTDTSNYEIGHHIYAISGATLSVHSVSKGVHKLTLIINEIIENFNEK